MPGSGAMSSREGEVHRRGGGEKRDSRSRAMKIEILGGPLHGFPVTFVERELAMLPPMF
jgi:hypothetical protein